MDSQITLIQAAALALIQGLTEFLPVSSSGHLVLARDLFGWSGECGLAFDTVLHAGSLLALLIYFRRDLITICRAWLAPAKRGDDASCSKSNGRRELWLLGLATLPAALAGPFLKQLVESDCVRNSLVAGSCMIATALFFLAAERRRSFCSKEMSFMDAIIVGCAQIVALLPGASRSGWTIGAGIARGVDRPAAARFSFLMAIPVIAGALLLQLKDIANSASEGIAPAAIALVFLISFLVSMGAIHFCMRFFRRNSLKPFAIYLLIAGSVAILSFLIAQG